jgi:hypothetical protein
MKKVFAALCYAAFMSGSYAQSAPPVQKITKQVIRSVTSYADGISCHYTKIDAKMIAALVPYKTMDDRDDAKYAVLWPGDIGCAGGSGSDKSYLSIVRVSIGDSYVVDPLQSSPVIKFESPVRWVERIVGNTRDSLILEGKGYGPEDPNCCPSIPVRFTMRVDKKGNWKVTKKKVLVSKYFLSNRYFPSRYPFANATSGLDISNGVPGKETEVQSMNRQVEERKQRRGY